MMESSGLALVRRWVVIAFLGLSLHAGAQVATSSSSTRSVSNTFHLGLRFEPNLGQYPAGIKFVARQPRSEIALTADEAIVALMPDKSASTTSQTGPAEVRIQLLNADRKAQIQGEKELPGRTNYLVGNDPKKWHVDGAAFGQVHYRDVYPGIDLVYYGNSDRQLEHDFVIRPQGSPDDIHLRITGAKKLSLDTDGNLDIETGSSSMQLKQPTAYQEGQSGRQPVAARYVLTAGGEISFVVDHYDHARTLVVDPVVAFFNTPIFGGTSVNLGNGLAVDSQGDMFVVGTTYSTDFQNVSTAQGGPGGGTNCGSFGSFMVCSDAFVAELDSWGNFVYFTYLGGNLNDTGASIAIDGSGNAYVTGSTQSTNFPTMNAAQNSWGGGTNCGAAGEVRNCTDAFVAALNSSGTLIYSTYLGGSSADSGTSVVATTDGTVWVAGQSQSTNLTATTGAFATTCATLPSGLCNDGFIAQLSSAGALTYLSYLSGAGNAVALDPTGVDNLAYATGAASSNFATTGSAYQATPGGATDGFLVKVDGSQSGAASLPYASYLNTNGGSGTGVTVDGSGNAYVTTVTGQTAAVLKLNLATSGSMAQAYLTTFPTPTYVTAVSPILDTSGNLYVTGEGEQSVFGMEIPTWYVAELNTSGALPGTDYFDSADKVSFNQIAIASNQTLYLAGTSYSNNIPGSVFIDRFAAALPPVLTIYPNPAIFPQQTLSASAQINVNIANESKTLTETISNIAISPGFSQTSNCTGLNLGPGVACEFLLTYTGHSSGVTTGLLTFTSTSSPTSHSVLLYIDAGIPSGSFSPASIDFGSVTVGSSVTKTVTLSNSGNGLLPIGLVTAADLTESHDCGVSLAPGIPCHVTLTFSPKTNLDVPGNVTFYPYPNQSSYFNPIVLNVAGGTVGPSGITLTPTTLKFTQTTGTSAAQMVTFANTTTNTLSNVQLAATGSFAIQSTTCGSSLAASSSCTINVTFTPATSGATSSGNLNESDSSGGLTNYRSVGLVGNLAGTPSLSASPSSLNLGSDILGVASTPKTFTITNASTASGYLVISSIVANGPFAEDNDCVEPLAPSATCMIIVSYTATATGSQTGNVTITSNTTQKVLSLSGTGNAPVPVISSISPATEFSGSPTVTLTVTGSNFSSNSTVVWNPGSAVNLPTTFVNSTTLTATLANTLLITASSPKVSVTTPTPGGGTSSTKTFTITTNNPPTGALESALYLPTATSTVPLGSYLMVSGWAGDPDEGSPVAQVQVQVTPVTGTGTVSQNATLGIVRSDIVASTGKKNYYLSGWTTAIPTSGLTTGTYTVSAVASDSAGAMTTLPTSQTITVGPAGSGPVLGVASSLAFGNMVVGGTLQQTLFVTNVGSGTLTVSSVGVTGPFWSVNTCGAGLSAGASCTLTVAYAPMATGSASGVLTLNSNGTPAASTVMLSGNGVAFTVTVGRPERPSVPSGSSGGTRAVIGAKNVVSISTPGLGNAILNVSCVTDTPSLACNLSSSTVDLKDGAADVSFELVPNPTSQQNDSAPAAEDAGQQPKVSLTLETADGTAQTVDLKVDPAADTSDKKEKKTD